MKYLLLILVLSGAIASGEAFPHKGSSIMNGVPWYDKNGKPVSAHGANIIRENNKYWLLGEYKTDSANVFTGFSCYSSDDLCNWRFERIALSQQQEGRLGPGRVALYGTTDSAGGYAEITIRDKEGKTIFSTPVDFYSKVPATGLRWVSPYLPDGHYSLEVRVSEMKPNWSDKSKTQYGSTGYHVTITKIASAP